MAPGVMGEPRELKVDARVPATGSVSLVRKVWGAPGSSTDWHLLGRQGGIPASPAAAF